MWFFKNYGVLGQNARNLHYIQKYNSTKHRHLADSKLQTKQLLSKKGVKVAHTIAIIKDVETLEHFHLDRVPLPFVVKPNSGFGGRGILVLESKDADGNFVANSGNIYTLAQLRDHLLDILRGFHSMSGKKDAVILERKITLDHSIEILGKYGLPDIRVIVFNMIPVMAMFRVPTEKSQGKANLHAGACALGIDIGTGKITYMVQHRHTLLSLPGIGDVRGMEIPHWEAVLKLAVQVQKITGVGFVGCDIVLDNELGPIVLEMNVRPGLEIQNINHVALGERLKKVENIEVKTIEKGIRLAKDLFGGDIEEKITSLSGKQILGHREYIHLSYQKTPFQTIAKISPNSTKNIISENYLLNVIKYPPEKIKDNTVRLPMQILGEKRKITFQVEPSIEETFHVVLGKSALYGFLLDPFKYRENDLPGSLKNSLLKEKNILIIKNYKEQLQKVDEELFSFSKRINITAAVTPKNVHAEKQKFLEKKGNYAPQLVYDPLKIDPKDLAKKLKKIEIPDVPLSSIFARKKTELEAKLGFLEAFVHQDVENMQYFQSFLWGDIIPNNLEYARDFITQKTSAKKYKNTLDFPEIKKYVQKFSHIYDIPIICKEKEFGSRFGMNGNAFLVKKNIHISTNELRIIVAHEIETHYLRTYNGGSQPYKIFSSGTAGYLVCEEGLALHNQMIFLSPSDPKYSRFAYSYLLLHILKTYGNEAFFDHYTQYFPKKPQKMFNDFIRNKRGIQDTSLPYVCTKNAVYLNGFVVVEEFKKSGGDLKDLYFGKGTLQDLEEIREAKLIPMKKEEWKIPFFYS